jgi:predicted Zn-dependent protease
MCAVRIVGAPGLLVAVLLSACAVNPVTRRPELAMVSQSTELAIGAEQAKVVEREMGLLGAPELVAYVRAVGERLAASSPRRDVPYAFHVVDTPEPNAFAVPGHVYVTRGLLVLLNDEDELAGVLAHEVGHIAARHAVQRLSRAVPAGIVTDVVAGVTGMASPLLGSLFQVGGDLATAALLAPYSREQEREADRVGQEITAGAGWDPAGLARSLATLERAEAYGPAPRRRPSFLDSHPSTPERVGSMAAYARALPRGARADGALGPEAFLAHLDGLVIGQGAAQGIFEKTTFLHPDLGFHLRYPDGWKTENTATLVAGAAADGTMGVVLSLAVDGSDPLDGVRAFEKGVAQPLIARVERTTIDGLAAAHISASAESDGRRAAIELWWIALGGHVFQLTGIAPARSVTEDRPVIESVARSFGALTDAERRGIREPRLRLLAARPGESLGGLTARSRTPWKPELVAIVNGLDERASIPMGRRIKVAQLEAYPAGR